MKTSLRGFALGFLAFAAWVVPGRAQTSYVWSSTGPDFNWSTVGDWSPAAGTGGPTGTVTLSGNNVIGISTGDTASLNDTAGVDRTVSYDGGVTIYGVSPGTSLWGALGTLNITQTGAGINALDVTKNLWVNNAATLGAAGGGTAQVIVESGANFALTNNGLASGGVSGGTGLTLSSGGVLTLRGGGSVGNSLNSKGGNVMISGGTYQVGDSAMTSAATFSDYSTITMTSGTLAYYTGLSGNVNSNLIVYGNVTTTGGAITTAGGAGALTLLGATNSFSGTAISTTLQITMQGGDQSLTTDAALGTLLIRSAGVNVKTVTSTAASHAVGSVILFGSAAGSSSTLKLGSDLTQSAGSAALVASSSVSGTPDVAVGLDANGHIYDMTAVTGTGVFTPNQEGGVAHTTTWNLTSSAAGGKIRAVAYNFNGNPTKVLVNVGPNLTLEATGGNNSANNLSGTSYLLSDGTTTVASSFDPTSTFLYTGGATTRNTAATLTSNRAIGNLQVTNGYLNVLAMPGVSNVAISGTGALDLNNANALTLTLAANSNFSLNGGTLIFTLGTAADQIVGSGAGTFSFMNGTLALDLGTGFSYSSTYALFSGFSSGISSNITFTGLTGYTASLDNNGVLSFNAVPEPSALASMAFGTGVLLFFARRRLRFPA